MVIEKRYYALFVLLWFNLGCHTQNQSNHHVGAHDTQKKAEAPSSARERDIFPPDKGGEAGNVGYIVDGAGRSQAEKGPLEIRSSPQTGPNKQFRRSLSPTALKFGLYNCRSALHDVNRAIDKLTAKTQLAYWEFVKERFSASEARYVRLCEDGSEAARCGAVEQASIQQKLAELESMLLETGNRMERSNREYVQQRRLYELRKRQDFIDRQSEQTKKDSTARCFYADARIKIGLTAMEETFSHVLVTLEAYAHRPGTPVSEEQTPSTPKEGLSSAEGLEDYVHLVDQHSHVLGPPQEIQYDRLHALDGLIVTMAFVRDPLSERTPIQLKIKPSVLGNAAPITLVIPPDQESERLARILEGEILEVDAHLQAAHSDEPTSTSTGIKVIRCQRENMHLKVPVKVHINGMEVKTAMLLDTGASVTVLSKSVYNRGLARPMAELKTMRLATANGPMTCPVDTLRVSTTAYARSIPVALTDESMSLLGANYLAGHRLTIDLDRECIYVHPKQP